MPRNESPTESAYDDETPEHVQDRMRELERLALDLWRFGRLHGEQWMTADLTERAVRFLDLDPPGFDPATEG